MYRAAAAAAILLVSRTLPAQTAGGLTLEQAVQTALARYPSVRVSQAQIDETAAAISLARAAYLPRIDAAAQVNRATRNNVFGLLLPQSTLPQISGPVLGSNNFGSVWGSAIGALVTWEPFDFGLRSANVGSAAAARAQSEAALKKTEFALAVQAADAYLTLAAAQATVRAAQAGVDRAEVAARSVKALADAELRPGADVSRAEAELAAARTQFIQAGTAVEMAKALLAGFTGGDPGQLTLAAPAFERLPAVRPPETANLAANPEALERQAAVEQAQAQMRALERSYFPRFYLQAAASARGSGAEVDGTRLGGLNGLAPSVQNYALGFSVQFPILDFVGIRARIAAQAATVQERAALADQVAVELRARWNSAVAEINGARQVAANTPAQVSAARDAERQASARYESGLGSIDQLAEAQRVLTQAEIDDALARLGVWRGLLGIAAAAGDIQPFVAEAAR